MSENIRNGIKRSKYVLSSGKLLLYRRDLSLNLLKRPLQRSRFSSAQMLILLRKITINFVTIQMS